MRPCKHRVGLVQQVGVREHHTLRIGGGPGGIEQRCQIFRSAWNRLKPFAGFSIESREDALEVRVGRDNRNVGAGNRCLCSFQMLLVANEQEAAAIAKKFGDLVRMVGSVQGHGCSAGGDNAQVRRYPTRMIICKDGHASAWIESAVQQRCANGFRHAAQLGIAVTFNSIRPLYFNREILRPALGAFDESIVESGHVRNGILH